MVNDRFGVCLNLAKMIPIAESGSRSPQAVEGLDSFVFQSSKCYILGMANLEPLIIDEIDAAADAEGLADLDAGRIISHDAMKAWLMSWGTSDELSPPRVGD